MRCDRAGRPVVHRGRDLPQTGDGSRIDHKLIDCVSLRADVIRLGVLISIDHADHSSRIMRFARHRQATHFEIYRKNVAPVPVAIKETVDKLIYIVSLALSGARNYELPSRIEYPVNITHLLESV